MATVGNKRSYEEFEDVSAIEEEEKSAKIQGVVASLSPMKQSASGRSHYFDGQLSDGKRNIWLVGFDSKQQQRLAEFQEKKEAVALCNCEVKRSKFGAQLEVLVGRETMVEKSPGKFPVVTLNTEASNNVTMNQLLALQVYQRVNVCVKVIREGEVTELKNGLKHQDISIGDATGTGKLTVWEKNTGQLKTGMCYNLSGVMVRQYEGRKFLSVPKEGAEINPIDDIGDIKEENPEDICCLKDAVVVGVMGLDTFRSCLMCKGKVKVSSPESGNVAKCEKCSMILRLDRCQTQMVAKVIVESEEVTKTLSIFSPILQEICEGSDVTKEALVSARSFDLWFSPSKIVTRIIRK